MDKLPGIGLLLFAAIGIGMTGTLTMVMAEQPWTHLCPAGFKADPSQTFRTLLYQGYVHCVKIGSSNPMVPGQFEDVQVSKEERHKLCMEEGVAGDPGYSTLCI